MVDISAISPMDEDVVDEIERNCAEFGVPATCWLAICWHETGGGMRAPDGGTYGGRRAVVAADRSWRTFLGGDVDPVLGVRQSAGPFHVYITLHGPKAPDGRPDYAAGFAKWDNVTTTMQYLWGNRWRANWEQYRGPETYAADPVKWLDDNAQHIQGSWDWKPIQAETAYAVAEREHAAFLARHQPVPPPPPPPPPTPEPGPVNEEWVLRAGIARIALSVAQDALADGPFLGNLIRLQAQNIVIAVDMAGGHPA